mgnify:CR=1 FL=1
MKWKIIILLMIAVLISGCSFHHENKENQKNENYYKLNTDTTISNYEKGKVSPPIELLIKLAERYDVSIDWLCGLSNEEIPRLMSYGDAFFRLVEIDKVIGFSVEDVTFFSNLRGTAVLFDATLTKALEEYQEMVNLRDNNTISEHLFNLWISDKVQQLDKQYRLLSNQTLKNLKKMDKDLEKSIKQKEGETNGNSTKKG